MSAATTPVATSAHVCTAVYTHETQPAVVAGGEYAHQRRYGPNAYSGTRATQLRSEVSPATTVYRNAEDDLAEITLRIGLSHSAEISIQYTPAQLRELAGRLLDAAADIEANPAAKLLEGGAA